MKQLRNYLKRHGNDHSNTENMKLVFFTFDIIPIMPEDLTQELQQLRRKASSTSSTLRQSKVCSFVDQRKKRVIDAEGDVKSGDKRKTSSSGDWDGTTEENYLLSNQTKVIRYDFKTVEEAHLSNLKALHARIAN